MTFGLFPSRWRSGVFLCLLALGDCAGDATQATDAIATPAGMHREILQAADFRLTTYARVTDINQPVAIYIEGKNQNALPDEGDAPQDAPPADALGLRLAALDPSPNVIYIAQPCQFTDDAACDSAALDGNEFAAQTLISINNAVDRFAVRFQIPRIHIVGYSSGAAIAAILTVRRHDIVSLRTIAGDLDPDGAARYHDMMPADNVLDPMPLAYRLALLPQLHYAGGLDHLIPPFITGNFIQAEGASRCLTWVIVPGATHDQGWTGFWWRYASTIPICKSSYQQ